jgi:hypothetical protein
MCIVCMSNVLVDYEVAVRFVSIQFGSLNSKKMCALVWFGSVRQFHGSVNH